jgi:hypothetical protein
VAAGGRDGKEMAVATVTVGVAVGVGVGVAYGGDERGVAGPVMRKSSFGMIPPGCANK